MKLHNKYILDKFYQEYINNFLLGSLPILSFFIFFPFYSKFMSKENFDFTLKIIPVFATVLAIDLGANRFVLRAFNLKRSKNILEKILSNYFNNILFFSIIFLLQSLFIFKYFNLVNTNLTNSYLIILLSSPILIVSNIYYIFFDTHSKFNNNISSPLTSSTWIALFLLSFFKYDNFLTIVFSFLIPRVIIFILQMYFLPFRVKINFRSVNLLFKDRKSGIYLISSILTPLCSNIDRLILIILNAPAANWLIVYNGLSEVSRKTGGIIKPITRIYFRLNHLTISEKDKLNGLNNKISLVNVILTMVFSFFFLKNLSINSTYGLMNIDILFPIICATIFIITSFLQVNSSVLYLKSMINGKVKIIVFYQLLQLFIFSLLYILCYKYFSIIFIPIIYLLMRFLDFYFLKYLSFE